MLPESLSEGSSSTTKAYTLRDALREGLRRLLAHPVPSASLAAELLLMHVLERDRAYLYAHGDHELPAPRAERYFRLIAERLSGKPTQYITGHQEFWGLDFVVTPDVLIPRPETEHLVEALIERAAADPPAPDARPRLVDVGTGSGCIALALAKEFPRAEIYATDISSAALGVAARNAARLGLSGRVQFRETDLLTYFLKPPDAGSFDFVVSNPPYVGRNAIAEVQREVREFEPRLAWGGLERGDEIYRRLFPEARQALKPGGWVVVEIGYRMRDAVLALLTPGWTDVAVRPDLAGIPRVVIARKARR
jgi:release factor glutamine methyltransferase